MAGRLPFDDLQKAAYTAVNAALSGTASVYSWIAPEDATYPYVVLTRYEASPDPTKTTEGCVVVGVFEIYSDSTSATETNGIANSIVSTLNGAALTIANNFRDIGIRRDWSASQQVIYDEGEDKMVFLGTVNFTWQIEDQNA